jgi:LysM repeat protein
MTTTTRTWAGTYQEYLTEAEQLNNAQLIADHFAGTDWTKEAIAALCGNMHHESILNPQMSEFGYAWEDDRGYGLVQWTPRSKYWDWATANSLDPYSGDSQLARIDYEVVNNIQWFDNPNAPEFDSISFSDFRSGAGLDVPTLVKCFMAKYEHPNWSAGTDSLADRQAFAQQCFDTLDWTGTGSGGGGVVPPPSKNIPPVVISPQNKYETEGTLNNMTYVQVKAGDTLSALAQKYGVSVNEIKKVTYSEIPNKSSISVGTVLILPNSKVPLKNPTVVKKLETTPVYYTVKSGDSLTKLAIKYNTTLAKIQAWNNIPNPNLIKVGQKLRVK